MSDFLRDYLTVVWFGAIALVLAGLLLGIAAVVRPNKPTAQKLMAYESGVNPVGDGWSQSQVRYYIFALLFVVMTVFGIDDAGKLIAQGLIILMAAILYGWRSKRG